MGEGREGRVGFLRTPVVRGVLASNARFAGSNKKPPDGSYLINHFTSTLAGHCTVATTTTITIATVNITTTTARCFGGG